MYFTMDAPDIYPLAFGILAVAILILLIMILDTKSKLKKLLVGTGTLPDAIFQEEMRNYLTTVEKRLKKSVQAVHTVRFNPFKGTGSGGNQSFATALLNENGDGVVISTLYAREHISIFSKPVKKGKSEYELSEEEKEAVSGALSMVKG